MKLTRANDIKVGRKYELLFLELMRSKGYTIEDLNLKDQFSKMDFKLKNNKYIELKSRSRHSDFFLKNGNDFMLEKSKIEFLLGENKSAYIFYLLEDGLFYYMFKPKNLKKDIRIKSSKSTGRSEDRIKDIAYIRHTQIKKFSKKLKYNEGCLID